MRIDKNSVWFVASCKAPNIISYSDDTPDYIRDWFKEHRPKLSISDEIDKKEPTIPFNMERWPTPDELQDDVLYFYVTANNYRDTKRFIGSYRYWKMSYTVKFPCGFVEETEDREVNLGVHDIIQYSPIENWEKKNYRRVKLSKWLGNNYDYARADEFSIGECDTLIISRPHNWQFVAESIKHNQLIFDRSDYWAGDGIEEETSLIKAADIVINSTDFLYQDSLKYNKNCYLIYNGSTVRDYKKLPKIDRYVYIGRSGNKIDWEWMNSLDLPVDVYGEIETDLPKYDNITIKGYKTEEELTEVLSQYKAGLVAFNTRDFNRGMLPIKIFNYLDAGLEVITHNCPEADNYLKYHKDEPHDWNTRFEGFRQFIDKKIKMDDIVRVEKTNDNFKISWKMTDACNYRCPYCYMKEAVAKQKHTPQEDVERIASRIDKLIEVQANGKDVMLHLIGGEICLYDLISVLDKIKSKQLKSVIFATNFSKDLGYWNKLSDYCRKRDINPIIIASFHLTECNHEEFVDKAMKLGVHVKAVVNADNIETYRLYFDRLVKNGNAVEVTVERDNENSAKKLTEEQLHYVSMLNSRLLRKQVYFKVTLKNGRVISYPSNISFINSIDVGGFDPEGFVCTAGLNGIRIAQDGSLRRAGCRHASVSQNRLGSIFDDDIWDKLPKEPWICKTREAGKDGILVHKMCTCFGNASMWRKEDVREC